MELVYLWVEDYKNIHKQGFNFSPRFDCKYENDELTIIDKKETGEPYLKNFFGDNINVTAIVGKNGSGKSSVLISIIQAMGDNQNITPLLMVFRFNHKVLIVSNINIRRTINNISLEYEYIKKECEDLPYILHYDYSFSFFGIPIQSMFNYPTPLQSSFYEIETHKNMHFVPHKATYNPIEYNESIEKKNMIMFFLEINHHEVFGKYFMLDTIEVEANAIHQFSKEKSYQNIDKNVISKFKEIEATCQTKYDYLSLILCQLLCKSYIGTSPNYACNQIIKQNNLNEVKTFFKNEVEKKLEGKDTFKPSLEIIYKKMKGILEYIDIIEKNKNAIENIFDSIEEIGFPSASLTGKLIKINIPYLKDNNKYLDIILKLPTELKIHLKNKNGMRYEDLSNGEKSILRVRYYIENFIIRNKNTHYLMLLDEPSNDMHPDWQKKLLKYLVDVFKDRKEKFHFILTTHSPFLLSDIPKQNIIFLDKDQKGNCKVVDGLKEKKQTFGANIHTLLSDSFFMEDGLMGEFAKSKIDKTIKLLNQDKLSDHEIKYCEQIISIIGEPIIKNQLQRMLDSKRLKKVDEIDKIKETMEDLQKRLNELENG